MAKRIEARPVKLKSGEWGMRTVLKCPVPEIEDEMFDTSNANLICLREWFESLHGKIVIVVTQAGKCWPARIGDVVDYWVEKGDEVCVTTTRSWRSYSRRY